jgi:hypothetical protein
VELGLLYEYPRLLLGEERTAVIGIGIRYLAGLVVLEEVSELLQLGGAKSDFGPMGISHCAKQYSASNLLRRWYRI